MSDSAELVCFDCKTGLELGWFWNTAEPRYIFTPQGIPASQELVLSRALWRFLAEHVNHNARLLGEQTDAWDDVELDEFVMVGGDRTLGMDPTFDQYVAGWPRPAAALTQEGREPADLAYAVCLEHRVALPLGWFWPGAESDLGCLFDAGGVPTFEQAERNRALWKMLADHVYHDVRFRGERTGQLDPGGYTVLGGDRRGVDPPLPDFLAGWPG
jgi:hypothetical protein